MPTVDPTDATLWHGGAHSPVLRVLGFVFLVISVGLLPGLVLNDDRSILVPPFATLAFSAAVMFGFARLEARVSTSGLHVQAAPVAFFRMSIRPDEIRQLSVVEHRTLRWGLASGIGYRGSLRLFRRAAWVLRSGPALAFDLAGGRRFTLTVDDAEGAAAALEQLR